jgi:hypothetical protein
MYVTLLLNYVKLLANPNMGPLVRPCNYVNDDIAVSFAIPIWRNNRKVSCAGYYLNWSIKVKDVMILMPVMRHLHVSSIHS